MSADNRPAEPAVTLRLALEEGMTAEEYERAVALLGRTPTWTKLALSQATWSASEPTDSMMSATRAGTSP